MTHPYRPPQSSVEVTPTSASNTSAIILLLAGLVCALLTALVPTLAIPQFEQVFVSFGASLPLLTRLAIEQHLWLWLLPLLVVAARLFWHRPKQRPLVACLVGTVGLGLGIPLLILAMYLPILQLGQII
jgi:type II secretory pathway component PulF